MLSVQKVNYSPAFQSRSRSEKSDLKEDPIKLEWEGYRDEFEGLENDDNLPTPVRKFAKFMKVLSGGVVTGLGVVWASKKAGELSRKAVKSKTVKNAKKEAGKLFEAAKEPLKKFGTKVKVYFAEKMTKLAEKEKMQKLITKLKNFKETKVGKLYVKAEKFVKKVVKYVKEKYAKLTKGITFKKVNNTTANVMGIGSGVAASYELAKNEGEE